MEKNPPSPSIQERFRWILPALVVVLLARFSVAKDSFAQLTRPIVLELINLFGGQAADLGSSIRVGRLDVPWSSDCAGLNMLVLLLAVAIWMNRDQPMGKRYWLRLFLMVPAAALANVTRVFIIIAYREIFYPNIESQQLHYFFGLTLLVPFSLLAMPKSPRSILARIFELLHVAAVIAMLAPNADGTEGSALTIAVILGLSHCGLPETLSRGRLWAFVVWIFAAAFIALSGMESFWLPWLMVCPLVCDPKWLMTLPGILITLASHRLLTILPGGQWLIWVIIGYAVWENYFRNPQPKSAPSQESFCNFPKKIAIFTASLLFLLPFLSSMILAGTKEPWSPPSTATTEEVPGGQLVTLPGQSEEIGVLWYDSQGIERHHKLAICLKYRGVELKPSEQTPEVFSDGTHWMREYYLQNNKLHQNHLQYVISTIGPGNGGGVHLILVTKQSSMSSGEFAKQAGTISNRLFEMIQAEKTHPQQLH